MFVVLAGLGGLTPPTKMRVVVGLAGILGGVNPPSTHPGTYHTLVLCPVAGEGSPMAAAGPRHGQVTL